MAFKNEAEKKYFFTEKGLRHLDSILEISFVFWVARVDPTSQIHHWCLLMMYGSVVPTISILTFPWMELISFLLLYSRNLSNQHSDLLLRLISNIYVSILLPFMEQGQQFGHRIGVLELKIKFSKFDKLRLIWSFLRTPISRCS